MAGHGSTRRMPAGSAALTASLCLMLLVLVGCNGNSGATPPPTPPSESASPTRSPTPSRPAPPTLPPAAKGLTVESADAFTRFYLTLLDYAASTGDVAPLQSWSDKGCVGCGDLIRRYVAVFSAGGSYRGDYTIKNVATTSVRLNQTKAAEVKFRATIGRHAVLEKRGASPIVYPGETIRWRLALLARKGQWITYEMEDEAG